MIDEYHLPSRMPLFSNKTLNNRIAYFISSHGFGHATRSAAVMAALHELDASIGFDIFSNAPIQIFQESLPGPFTYHSMQTDVGIVQKTPLSEDLHSTIQRLNDFLPFDRSLIASLSGQIKALNCNLIICDIAPMGIAVALEAEVPSILIENFTWDWIYKGYTDTHKQFEKHSEYLRELFHQANYRIQTEPICRRRNADLNTAPVSRKVMTPAHQVRSSLGIPNKCKIMMITMGGIPSRYDFLQRLEKQKYVYFVIPGASSSIKIQNNLIQLPYNSEFFHPDLINASHAVIGKAGYSTLAEIYHAGIPYGYIPRPSFRESATLSAFIKENMAGFPILETEFHGGNWLHYIPALLALPTKRPNSPNGADQIAGFIFKLLNA